MSPEASDKVTPPGGSSQLRLAVYVLVFLTGVGLVLWAVTSISESSGPGVVPDPYQGARVVEPSELKAVEREVGHRIYWAGEQPGFQLAISRDGSDNVHVRYLPEGQDPESPGGAWLDIGSYPFDGALKTTRQMARQDGRVMLDFGWAAGFQNPTRPQSVIVAFRDDPDTQVEVAHPIVGHAAKLIQTGAIAPIP